MQKSVFFPCYIEICICSNLFYFPAGQCDQILNVEEISSNLTQDRTKAELVNLKDPKL